MIFLSIINDKIVMETRPYGPFTMQVYKQWLLLQDMLEAELVKKGVHRLWCLVKNIDQKRWAEFLGYTFNDENWNNAVDVMYKDI